MRLNPAPGEQPDPSYRRSLELVFNSAPRDENDLKARLAVGVAQVISGHIDNMPCAIEGNVGLGLAAAELGLDELGRTLVANTIDRHSQATDPPDRRKRGSNEVATILGRQYSLLEQAAVLADTYPDIAEEITKTSDGVFSAFSAHIRRSREWADFRQSYVMRLVSAYEAVGDENAVSSWTAQLLPSNRVNPMFGLVGQGLNQGEANTELDDLNQKLQVAIGIEDYEAAGSIAQEIGEHKLAAAKLEVDKLITEFLIVNRPTQNQRIIVQDGLRELLGPFYRPVDAVRMAELKIHIADGLLYLPDAPEAELALPYYHQAYDSVDYRHPANGFKDISFDFALAITLSGGSDRLPELKSRLSDFDHLRIVWAQLDQCLVRSDPGYDMSDVIAEMNALEDQLNYERESSHAIAEVYMLDSLVRARTGELEDSIKNLQDAQSYIDSFFEQTGELPPNYNYIKSTERQVKQTIAEAGEVATLVELSRSQIDNLKSDQMVDRDEADFLIAAFKVMYQRMENGDLHSNPEWRQSLTDLVRDYRTA
jgi:hypothetical protein